MSSAGKRLGAMWIYTALRFGLFLALAGVLWLVGVRGFLGWALAAVLSVPLSLVLLTRPRDAFARTLEQGINARREAKVSRSAKLEDAGETESVQTPANQDEQS